jgi:TPR repeat protein
MGSRQETAGAGREERLFATAFAAFFALPVSGTAGPAYEGGAALPPGCDARDKYMNTVLEYRRAAEAGNRSAQEMLGLMYLYGSQLYGEGVARDLSEAARWLECAAGQGSVLAKQLLRRYVMGETDRGMGSRSGQPEVAPT